MVVNLQDAIVTFATAVDIYDGGAVSDLTTLVTLLEDIADTAT